MRRMTARMVSLRMVPLAFFLVRSGEADLEFGSLPSHVFAPIGDGQCNGGVGGVGEHKCLIGGACNEGGKPLAPPTVDGTGCPGDKEYLLCTEDASINKSGCEAACNADTSCVGFMVSHHKAKGAGRCELHTKHITFAARPLECFDYSNGNFSLIGKGGCRTKLPTVSGPQNGTHYGNMKVYWVMSFDVCKAACRGSSQPCVGVEYHPTPSKSGSHKCEVHFETLSADQMSTFQCWARRKVEKIGDGQCNGGVGGVGEHKCMIGGSCNMGGLPSRPPTEDGTVCPGDREYLLCIEDESVTRASCQATCVQDPSCVGFMISRHAAKSAGRCELHTKTVGFAADPLECYTYANRTFTLIGKGACRTEKPTVRRKLIHTYYGNFIIQWVPHLEKCKMHCRNIAGHDTKLECTGIEYHPTKAKNGLHKCEVHFEKLGAEHMSVFECWNLTGVQTLSVKMAAESMSAKSLLIVVGSLLGVLGLCVLAMLGRRCRRRGLPEQEMSLSSAPAARPAPEPVGTPAVRLSAVDVQLKV